MKRSRITGALLIAAGLLLNTKGTTAQERIEKYVIGSGAADCANFSMRIAGTFGQPTASLCPNRQRSIAEGFWHAGIIEKTGLTVPPFAGEQTATLRCTPNPISGEGHVTIRSTGQGHLRLTLDDLLGRSMLTLIDEVRDPGSIAIAVRTDGMSPGQYTLTLTTDHGRQTLPIIIVR